MSDALTERFQQLPYRLRLLGLRVAAECATETMTTERLTPGRRPHYRANVLELAAQVQSLYNEELTTDQAATVMEMIQHFRDAVIGLAIEAARAERGVRR